MRALLNLVLAGKFALLACTPALADKRVALVIGNSAYQKVARLVTPVNDAVAVADMLKAAGFDSVATRLDGTYAHMRGALRELRAKSYDADIVVVYYAGYAAHIQGTNYLIPVDATLARDRHALDEALSLDELLSAVQSARKLGLVLLDACREYPFYQSTKALSASGLAKVEPPTNVLISFAARAGSIASDGIGQNSPYTRALLDHLAKPDVNIRITFDRIREDVLRATANAQEPSLFGSLAGEFYLTGPK
jgi:uncharacterized caspase-like protein